MPSWCKIGVYLRSLLCHDLVVHHFMNPMVTHINMCGVIMVCSIFAQIQSTLAIIVNHILILLLTQFLEKSFQPKHLFTCVNCNNIYSTSVVDKTTHFCSLDCYDTIPLEKVNTYLEVDFLLSRPFAISVLVYPSKIGFKP